jgi:hypothetical protein
VLHMGVDVMPPAASDRVANPVESAGQ